MFRALLRSQSEWSIPRWGYLTDLFFHLPTHRLHRNFVHDALGHWPLHGDGHFADNLVGFDPLHLDRQLRCKN